MMQSGHENVLVDTLGVKWLDFLSGVLNVSLGHGHPIVNQALQEVIDKGLINTYDRYSENQRALGNLLRAYDERFLWRIVNTGSEAVERSIQVCAELIGKRPVVAVLPNSFHGKSISMSAVRYAAPWGNPMKIVTLDPFDLYASSFDMLIYEPIRGWDGVQADESKLRKLCDNKGALLVADEMITGFLRCGKRFLNKTADMVISGKGIAQGIPLAVLGINKGKMPKKFTIGWNTTTGGNNLSATVGLFVLRYLLRNEEEIKSKVLTIERSLQSMGFTANGALGFKMMVKPQAHMRPVFEWHHLIVSWHEPFIRVGPSFTTSQDELILLDRILKLAERKE